MSFACDFHMHSSFSADSEAPMEDMVLRAIALGLDKICFTEHLDLDYHPEDGCFLPDIPAYQEKLRELKIKYADRITLLFGLEVGMQPHVIDRSREIISAYPFDYVLASQHLVYGRDPWYGSFWIGRDEKQVLRDYFSQLYQNLQLMDDYDTCAHLDYIIRYLPSGSTSFDPSEYMDLIEPILKYLIANEKNLEVNTSPYAKGYDAPNPGPEILKTYYALGGRRIALGSDAHDPAHIAGGFDKALKILKDIGFPDPLGWN